MLSIIIPVRNQIEFTRRCLESLFAGTCGDYRIVLIDNGCHDGTAEWVMERCEAHGIDLDVIAVSGVNLSRCWNEGILAVRRDAGFGDDGLPPSSFILHPSSFPLVAVINNDVVVGNGWDLAFARHFAAHPRTWCAAADCVAGETGEAFDREVLARAGSDAFHESPGWLPGYFMVFRLEAFERLGLFDDSYRIWYGDTDMKERLVAAGHPPVILRGAPIVHFGSKTTGSVPGHQAIIDADRARFKARYGHE